MIVAMREPTASGTGTAGSRNAQVVDAIHIFQYTCARALAGFAPASTFAQSVWNLTAQQQVACAESRASHEARVD